MSRRGAVVALTASGLGLAAAGAVAAQVRSVRRGIDASNAAVPVNSEFWKDPPPR